MPEQTEDKNEDDEEVRPWEADEETGAPVEDAPETSGETAEADTTESRLPKRPKKPLLPEETEE